MTHMGPLAQPLSTVGLSLEGEPRGGEGGRGAGGGGESIGGTVGGMGMWVGGGGEGVQRGGEGQHAVVRAGIFYRAPVQL